MTKTFDLEKRTLEFAKNTIRLCKKLPRNTINIELIAQLVKSAGSVGANYREANDSLSKKDFSHRMKITRKETKESYYWLELILESNDRFTEEIAALLQEAKELKSIFSSIVIKSS